MNNIQFRRCGRSLFLAFCLFTATKTLHCQWVTHGPGPLTQVRAIAVVGTDIFAGVHGGGVFRSTDNGTSWTATSIGSVAVHALAVSGSTLYAGSFGLGVWHSVDRGANWFRDTVGLSNLQINALAFSGGNLLAGTMAGVFVTDNQLRWIPDTTGMSDPQVYAFAPSLNVFAGTGGGNGGVYYSDPGISPWVRSSNGVPTDGVLSLAASGFRIFAGTNGQGIYQSNDNGATWAKDTTGMNPRWGYALTICGTNVLAGTENTPVGGGGIFLSTNNGASWEEIDSGLGSRGVTAIAVSPPEGGPDANVFLGTGQGVWQRPLSEIVTSVDPVMSQLPREFLLQQNYPNPFNPSTTISYALPHNSFVTLTVYNTLGQQVAQLVNEQQQAGYHEAVFRGDQLSSGIYFYRLDAGSYTGVKKLLLLK